MGGNLKCLHSKQVPCKGSAHALTVTTKKKNCAKPRTSKRS